MIIGQRHCGSKVIVAVIAAAIVLSIQAQAGDKHKYVEHFQSKSYCDAVQTTALWDTVTGTLKLPPFAVSLSGSYDTPDWAMGVAVAGDYAFVATWGTGLMVFNVSDLGNPVLLGTANTSGLARHVAVAGNYAFVADDVSGLTIVDVTNPASPTIAGARSIPGLGIGVSVSGDYAYVAGYGGGLQVINVGNVASPTIAGSCALTELAMDVEVDGDYAYVANHYAGLKVIDIKNPAAPTVVGTCNTPDQAWRVAIDGDYAYVADYYSGLQVIDITSPTSPVIIGSCDTPGYAFDVVVSGNRVYLADNWAAFHVIDVSDPTHPYILHSYATTDYARGIAGTIDHVFLACNDAGFLIFDVADVLLPPLATGGCPSGAYAGKVAVAGNYAYTANNENHTMQVYDINSTSSPQLVKTLNILGSALDITVEGNLALIGNGSSGLCVVNIADPPNAAVIGNCGTTDQAYGVAVAGDYAFVAALTAGVKVIDIHEPSTPTVAGTYDSPGSAADVAVSGDQLYVADWTGGLRVLSITNPASPTSIGSLSIPYASTIKVAGDYAYVGGQFDGFYVVDIRTPSNPVQIGHWATSGLLYDLHVDGDYAFLAYTTSGLQVLDVSDPTHPTFVGSCACPEGWLQGVAAAGDHVFGGIFGYGLRIFEVCQRRFDTAKNVGYSRVLDNTDVPIRKVLLHAANTDSIRWEVSADNGIHWIEMRPDSTWYRLAEDWVGSDILWRSTHSYSGNGVNSSCDSLVIWWDEILATMLESSSAFCTGDAIRLAWTLSEMDDGVQFSVLRRAEPDERFIELEGIDFEQDGLSFVVLDRGVEPGRTYRYRVDYADPEGVHLLFESDPVSTPSMPLALFQNHPNPFNPSTEIRFYLPGACDVTLGVYDLAGRLVATLLDRERKGSGMHSAAWRGLDGGGRAVSSGVYFYRLRAGKETLSRKLVLLR